MQSRKEKAFNQIKLVEKSQSSEADSFFDRSTSFGELNRMINEELAGRTAESGEGTAEASAKTSAASEKAANKGLPPKKARHENAAESAEAINAKPTQTSDFTAKEFTVKGNSGNRKTVIGEVIGDLGIAGF